ncbi:MAG: hypothetical protein ABIB47_03480 [Candidatus Woesearchaeota archaeon]
MKPQDIIIWILFIISIIVAIWYLFGNSPTFEQAILVFILTILFTNNAKISEIKTKQESLERKFNALAKDFKEHIKHKQI